MTKKNFVDFLVYLGWDGSTCKDGEINISRKFLFANNILEETSLTVFLEDDVPITEKIVLTCPNPDDYEIICLR